MSASCSPSSSRRERREVDAQRAHALELGQQRAQRVAPVQLVGPVGRDEQERLVAERGGEEAQERARRRVGPVQVLDHEQHRRGRARARRARRAAPRTRAPGRRRRARARAAPPRPGQQRRELGADVGRAARRAPGRASRTSGRSAVTSGAYASSPSPSSTQSPLSTRVPSAAARASQLGHEPALADARLADHERERRLPGGGVGERGLELRELERAPDEARRGDAGRHHPQGSQGARRQAAARGRRCSAACDDPQHLGDAVGHEQALDVVGGDVALAPRPASRSQSTRPCPVRRAEQHDREVADLAGLAQRRRLEQLVERAEAAGEDDERARVAHEHHLAREEVVEVRG